MAEENNVQVTGTTAGTPEKTFTQAEVDAMIADRLKRERKKYPNDNELSEFRSWKDSQQTEQERWDNLISERDGAKAELEQLRREKLLISKGVSADDVDFYAFKIGKLVTKTKTFEDAAEEYLKEKAPSQVKVDMGAPLVGGTQNRTPNDEMNALIRGALK